MKNRIRKLFLAFIFSLLSFSLYSQDNSNLRGIELSNSVFNFLKSNKFSPYTQNLVTSGENTFPYNILVDIPAHTKTSTNLLLIFFQEDIVQNSLLLQKTFYFFKNTKFDFNITMLFSYGEKQKIERSGMIYGTEVYLKSINTNEDYTAIIFDLSAENNTIISNSSGYSSPSWLIKNEYNIFKKSKINGRLPWFYISQINNLNIFQDKELSLLFQNNIPSIKLCFSNKTDIEDVFIVLKNSIFQFYSTTSRIWDHHYLLFNLFGRLFRLTESLIIRIIILIALLWLFFIFYLAFINTRLKKHNWQTIKKIWYSIPVTFVLIYFTVLFTRPFVNNFYLSKSDYTSIFALFLNFFFISLFICSAYYLISLIFNYKFDEKTIDLLIVLCTFLNQSIFIFIDISLFPIFMYICLLSILCILIKNNKLHLFIFILMIIPFIPYIHYVLSYCDPVLLRNYLYSSKLLPITFTIALYPVYIVYFRVLTSIRTHSAKINSLIISSCVFVFLTFLILMLFSIIRVNYLNKNNVKKVLYTVSPSSKYSVNIDYQDKTVFNDIIRTIYINCSEEPEFCNVTVSSDSSSPILYTDDEYEISTQNSALFKIPDNPPQNLIFSYGTENQNSKITVLVCFKNKFKENDYSFITKTISIENEE